MQHASVGPPGWNAVTTPDNAAMPDQLPRTRRTQASRSTETRQRVMDTAVALISERSFQAATVFEIAKRAGVTTGAVQHHFPSKADLILSLIDHLGTLPIESGGIWPAPTVPLAERAEAFVRALWLRSYEPARFLVAWSVYFGCAGEPAVLQHVGQRRDAMTARLHTRFAEMFPEAGGGEGCQTLVDTLLSCLRGLGVGRTFGADAQAEARQLRFIAGMVVQHCASVAPAAAGQARTVKPPARRRPPAAR